jgi:hypothetical protein
LIIIVFFVEAKPVQRIPFACFNTALARAGADEVPFRIAAAVFPPAPSALWQPGFGDTIELSIDGPLKS